MSIGLLWMRIYLKISVYLQLYSPGMWTNLCFLPLTSLPHNLHLFRCGLPCTFSKIDPYIRPGNIQPTESEMRTTTEPIIIHKKMIICQLLEKSCSQKVFLSHTINFALCSSHFEVKDKFENKKITKKEVNLSKKSWQLYNWQPKKTEPNDNTYIKPKKTKTPMRPIF